MIDTGRMDLLPNPQMLLLEHEQIDGVNMTSSSDNDNVFGSVRLPQEVYTAIGIYMSATGGLALIANAFVLLVFLRSRQLRNPTTLQLMNLCVADMGLVILGYPLAIHSNFSGKWLYGSSGCQWYGFAGFFFGNASMTTLSLLSVDRYLKICRPHSGYKIQTLKQAFVALGVIWIEALLFASCPIIGWSQYQQEPFQTSCTVDWYNHSVKSVTFIVSLTLFITANVIVIMVCYGCIARRLWLHKKQNFCAKNRKSKLGEHKSALLICLQVFGFLICWMPYAVTSLWLSYGGSPETSVRLTVLPTMFTKFSPLLNPLIYVSVNYNYRRACLEITRFRFGNKNRQKPQNGRKKIVRVSLTQGSCMSCTSLGCGLSSSSAKEENI